MSTYNAVVYLKETDDFGKLQRTQPEPTRWPAAHRADVERLLCSLTLPVPCVTMFYREWLMNDCSTFCQICYKAIFFTWKEIYANERTASRWYLQLCDRHLNLHRVQAEVDYIARTGKEVPNHVKLADA